MQLQGIPASAGLAWGRALHLVSSTRQSESPTIPLVRVSAELKRFDAAVGQAIEAIEAIRASLLEEGRTEEADIMEVQLVLLQDRELVGKARDKILHLHYASHAALEAAMADVLETMRQHSHPQLVERAMDLEDVVHRIGRNLRGEQSVLEGLEGSETLVLLCESLTPSEAVLLNPKVVAGIALIHGSVTSHVAIISRSMGIPTVVGLGPDLQSIADGQMVLLDGTTGTLTVDPAEVLGEAEVLREAEALRETQVPRETQVLGEAGDPMSTAEAGKRQIGRVPQLPRVRGEGGRDTGRQLLSNISSCAEAATALSEGAAGIGLFRTEFLFMGRNDFPSEEEQFATYRKVVSTFDARTPVIIRTMDVGGDKPLASLRLEEEDNPFLGKRGMRISLMRQDLLRTQLRAILRASAYGNIKLLFPMIATLGEWRQAKAIVAEVQAALTDAGIPYNQSIDIGIMIEVPSAALLADRLAQEADFLSIGTNDLIQYTMAASRNSPSLRKLHDPLQPAVLRLIHQVIRSAHSHGKPVSLCGEMASEMAALPLLLGMGLDTFSVSNEALASVGWQLSLLSERWDSAQLRLAAEAVLDLDEASDVRQYVQQHFPELQQVQVLP
ncbi:phosphoenolpyruvate--protein phosphotransferase [Paenibacillus daejeonensis]|uniref:phosphoenolpyruvate--protein phosphotransferase n=1 Tax=Paenibacillus daejeonensis TaxID=135193 RepID=UPI000370FE56|nr:phosphoenolpyruvate--protein phosphotransferase [Paenibacillus daejeonensis]